MTDSKLSPEAEQALDVAAARHALRTVPESSDLLDKVRAIEVAVSRRRSLGLVGFLATLAIACGEPNLDVVVQGPQDEPAAPSCLAVFSPAPELLEETRAAAERWSDATGCDVRVEDGGIPVVLVASLFTVNGTRAAGAWRHTSEEPDVCRRIDVDAEYGGPVTVAHEMGHCLGGRGHASSGLMAEGAPGAIDAPSLSLVCSTLECATFNPESI